PGRSGPRWSASQGAATQTAARCRRRGTGASRADRARTPRTRPRRLVRETLEAMRTVEEWETKDRRYVSGGRLLLVHSWNAGRTSAPLSWLPMRTVPTSTAVPGLTPQL